MQQKRRVKRTRARRAVQAAVRVLQPQQFQWNLPGLSQDFKGRMKVRLDVVLLLLLPHQGGTFLVRSPLSTAFTADAVGHTTRHAACRIDQPRRERSGTLVCMAAGAGGKGDHGVSDSGVKLNKGGLFDNMCLLCAE